MDIHGEEDEAYNAKADVMRGRGATKQLIAAGKEEGNYLARAPMQRSVKA